MVKPVYEKLAIDFWVYPGKLGITQPSLCLFHDSPQVGTVLLDALTELRSQTPAARLTLTFADSSRESPLRMLKLMLVPERDELKVMSIRRDGDTATIEMTDRGLTLVVKAIEEWLEGREDFGVAPRLDCVKPKLLGSLDHESGELWFWGPEYISP